MPRGVYERKLVPALQRILSRTEIDPETGCWRWPGARTLGYGSVRTAGRSQYVHVIVHEELIGPVSGTVDHVYDRGCRYKDCHNPDHLEDVPHAENLRRSWQARKAAQ